MCDICEEDISDSVHGEHIAFCDSDTCDINAAYDAGAYYWAASLLTGATECEATSASVERAIERHGTEAYEALVEESRKLLLEHTHERCVHCGSVSWDIADNWLSDPDAACPECGKHFGQWFVIPYSRTGEDEWTDSGVALFRARDLESARERFDSYVCDVTEELWGKHVTEHYDSSAEHSDAGFVYVMRCCDCDDEGCWSQLTEEQLESSGSDHDSLTVCIQWDAAGEFKSFATLDEAKACAEREHNEHRPVVVGEE